MGSFSVRLLPSAVKELEAVPFPFRRQINQRVNGLKSNPRPAMARVLAGEQWVLPIHGWLLLYEIDPPRAQVTVVAIVTESADG